MPRLTHSLEVNCTIRLVTPSITPCTGKLASVLFWMFLFYNTTPFSVAKRNVSHFFRELLRGAVSPPVVSTRPAPNRFMQKQLPCPASNHVTLSFGDPHRLTPYFSLTSPGVLVFGHLYGSLTFCCVFRTRTNLTRDENMYHSALNTRDR